MDDTNGGELLTIFESIMWKVELPIQIVEQSGDHMKEMV